MLLQKTEEVAKARQNVSEMLLSQISEEMRQQKRIKEQSFKRVSMCSCDGSLVYFRQGATTDG